MRDNCINKDVYTDFNDFYYYRLSSIVSGANSNSIYASFLKEISNRNIELDKVLYKRLVDDYEEIEIDSIKIALIPMGIINRNVPEYFIKKEERNIAGRYGNLNVFENMFLKDPNWGPLHYHSSDTLKQVFKRICDSYIDHYRKSLNEVWSEEDFYARLTDLEYLSVKYAKDLETGEVFAVGFFGALVKNGAGGKALTDAELYVMPEFRNRGIAKRMVGLTFELAQNDGIENFDSITYRVQSCDALSFWQRIGASVTGLTHIEGNISDIIEIIDKSSRRNRNI